MRATTPTIALILVLALCGCGGGGGQDKRPAAELIGKARQAEEFAGYARIFPKQAGKQRCGVEAGPRGNTFWGVCSSYIYRESGTSTVEFTQDFGNEGVYTWIVRVPHSGDAFVEDEFGNGLVQGIP